MATLESESSNYGYFDLKNNLRLVDDIPELKEKAEMRSHGKISFRLRLVSTGSAPGTESVRHLAESAASEPIRATSTDSCATVVRRRSRAVLPICASKCCLAVNQKPKENSLTKQDSNLEPSG
jgi:hypothetical protein